MKAAKTLHQMSRRLCYKHLGLAKNHGRRHEAKSGGELGASEASGANSEKRSEKHKAGRKKAAKTDAIVARK
jgi:hypothetical protein